MHLDGRLKVIAANTGWLLLRRGYALVVGILVGIWVARYLGPRDLGLLSYSIAFVGLLSLFKRFAPSGIIVRDLVRSPESQDTILGTALLLATIGRGLLVLVAAIAIRSVRPEQPIVWTLTLLAAGATFVHTADELELWFRAKMKPKYFVIARNTALTVAALVRVYLLATRADVLAFGFAYLLEAILTAIGLGFFYVRQGGNLQNLSVNVPMARAFLKEGWPVIISGACATIYLRIDQIMLGNMLGDAAVGVYSVVVRLSSLWYVLPHALVNSVFPSAVRSRDRSESQFNARMQMLFTGMAFSAYAVAIPVALLSDRIVDVLYGPKYADAGPVLAIHVFASLFVFLGVARGVWVTTESRLMFNLVANMLAAAANVLLNYLMIPRLGVVGAAYATVISYYVAYMGTGIIHHHTRVVFRMQLRALFLLDTPHLLGRARRLLTV